MKKRLFLAALCILSASVTTAYAGLFSFGSGGLGASGFGTSHIAGNLDADTKDDKASANDDAALAGAIDTDTKSSATDASSQAEVKTQAQLRK